MPSLDPRLLDGLRWNGIVKHGPTLGIHESVVDNMVASLEAHPMFAGHTGTGNCSTYQGALGAGWKAFAPSLGSVILTPVWFEYALGHLDLARAYFGGPAWLYSLNAFWVIPKPERNELTLWHRDTDAPKQMAVFMFGTDTTIEEGGHEYQVGTHLVEKDADLGRHVNEPPHEIVRCICGPRGTTFVTDPWGIHRGMSSSKSRILFWARFASSIPDEKFLRRQLIPASLLGDRYPEDPETREAIKLIVSKE